MQNKRFCVFLFRILGLEGSVYLNHQVYYLPNDCYVQVDINKPIIKLSQPID